MTIIENMAFVSLFPGLNQMTVRNTQLISLFTRFSIYKRTSASTIQWRTFSVCSLHDFTCKFKLTNWKRKYDILLPYQRNPSVSSPLMVLFGRTLSSGEPLTAVDQLGEEPRRQRSRHIVDISRDEWFTADQWRQMKADWLEVQSQMRKHYIPRSEFEYELRAMETIAAQVLPVSAKSFVAFIQEEYTVLKYPLMSKCLFMCTTCRNMEGLLWCVDWLEAHHDIMDKGTIVNAVSGLCMTERWRESEKFLSRADAADFMTSRILEPYLIAACEHGDRALAMSLLNEHYQRDLILSDATIIKLISTFKSDSEDQSVVKEGERIVTGFLDYMRRNRIYPSQIVAEEVGNWFKRKQPETWRISHTKISQTGVCKSCSAHLQPLNISEEEFNNLREEIFSKVIRGKDIFKKTTPQELEAFMKFIDSGPKYDIVIDGLNVAKLKKRMSPGKVLRQFVENLTKQHGHRCLVLGRYHMLKQRSQFTKGDMDAIQGIADCFFTQNMSEDDPFMLYATMHSGTETKYVTRDLLRDHKALLSSEANLSFIKWQRTQQLMPVDIRDGKPIFMQNLAHDTVIQSTDKSWHIPYDDGSPRFSYEVPLTWLCAAQVVDQS